MTPFRVRLRAPFSVSPSKASLAHNDNRTALTGIKVIYPIDFPASRAYIHVYIPTWRRRRWRWRRRLRRPRVEEGAGAGQKTKERYVPRPFSLVCVRESALFSRSLFAGHEQSGFFKGDDNDGQIYAVSKKKKKNNKKGRKK
jgi:hypothetical protein